MNLLIKSAKIVDPTSPFNGKKVNIYIENGVISYIGSKTYSASKAKIVESSSLHISPGWMDMRANFCDPGFEHKEDLTTGIKCAINGGYTSVLLMPSTSPPIYNKSGVEYIKNKTKDSIVDVFPAGCISHKMEGKHLAEMYDMYKAGAIAFTDDENTVQDAGLLLRALLYAKNFNGLITTQCDEKSLSKDGKINEGETSTILGLRGMPALAEEVMLNRNIYLTEYAEARIHIDSISTLKSVEMIKKAKEKKINITSSVNTYNLVLDETLTKEFDTNYKLNPPLRTKKDINALLKGLLDGTIDVIVSHHNPQDEENKKTEFDYAAFGMIGLETTYALLNSNTKLSADTLVKAIAINPRKILNIPVPTIKEGQAANLTFFDPTIKWTYLEKNSASKSKNTAFFNTKFTGKSIGVFNKNQFFATNK